MSRSILFIMSFLLVGCLYPPPEELDRSVFIADEQYPELPAYTEWGYNSFGAHYNDDVFLYSYLFPVMSSVLEDTFKLEFLGYLKNTGQVITISFSFPDFHPSQYSDLVALNANTYDLASSSVIIKLSGSGIPEGTIQSSGQLQFKRAQYLLVNRVPDRVILSGYFYFQMKSGNDTFTIKDGRFDVGINDLNFYKN